MSVVRSRGDEDSISERSVPGCPEWDVGKNEHHETLEIVWSGIEIPARKIYQIVCGSDERCGSFEVVCIGSNLRLTLLYHGKRERWETTENFRGYVSVLQRKTSWFGHEVRRHRFLLSMA